MGINTKAQAEISTTKLDTSLTKQIQITEVDGRTVTVGSGMLDDIEKRQVFDIWNKNTKIGQLRITRVQAHKSIGRVIHNYTGRVEPGNIVVYTGIKLKVGGAGITAGGDVFHLSSSTVYGFGIFYEFVGPKGWGVELNSSAYTRSDSYNYFPDDIYRHTGFGNDRHYSFPMLVKYHFFYDTNFSVYFGAGLYYNEVHAYWLTYTYSYDEFVEGPMPIMSTGIEFWAKHNMHLRLDAKLFIGKETVHSGSTTTLLLSPCLSYHW